MAPINEIALMLDLIRNVKLPAVVATRTSLGTINHTLMTLFALREAKLAVRGVVMIGANNEENRRAIEHYGNVQVIGQIPVLERLTRRSLLEVFNRQFDRQLFHADFGDISISAL